MHQVTIEFVPVTGKLNEAIADVKEQLASTGRVAQSAADVFVKANEQSAASQSKLGSEAKKSGDVLSAMAQKTADSIFAIEKNNHDRIYQDAIARLQKQQAFELHNHNLTAAQKSAIDTKYRKQEAALKLAQWKADQKSKEEQALMNGALAVTNALATTPFPANLVTAALAAATAAAEAAVIASQKPPQFYAKGTEYVKGPGTATSDSIPAMLSKGERIVDAATNQKLKGVSNHLLPELLKFHPAMPHAPENVLNSLERNQSAAPVIDYSKMARAFGEELSRYPQLLVHIDKNGYATHLLDKGSRREILNNRYTG